MCNKTVFEPSVSSAPSFLLLSCDLGEKRGSLGLKHVYLFPRNEYSLPSAFWSSDYQQPEVHSWNTWVSREIKNKQNTECLELMANTRLSSAYPIRTRINLDKSYNVLHTFAFSRASGCIWQWLGNRENHAKQLQKRIGWWGPCLQTPGTNRQPW